MRVVYGFVAVVLCWLAIRRHRPVKQPLGGFRCEHCRKPAASMDELGYSGYVPPLRTQFSRENHGTVTRSDRSAS